jgi:hypothetical protein
MKTSSLIRFVSTLALVCCVSRASAMNLNLPYGMLNSDFSIATRVGTFPNFVRYAPRPARGDLPAHFQGSGIFIIDLNTVRGIVDAARVFRSTGNRQVDNALINTLQKWRIQPRTIYKLHVPVTVTSTGRVVLGQY